MTQDPLGDRMKMYESAEAGRKLMPLLPTLARIDGRTFSKFTKGMARPYDLRLTQLMIDTTAYLVKETSAVCGYTQSDEITLCWLQPSLQSEIFFAGKIQKMVSQLAALATARFNQGLLSEEWTDKERNKLPTFDARVWNVPNLAEAMNAFLWREFDATKNSITMAASCFYSHKALQGKNGSEKQEMLFQKGVNWNDYPVHFKRGTYVRRMKTERAFTTEELDKLPQEHEARRNPELKVLRTKIVTDEIPPLSRIQNKQEVLFEGAQALG